MNGSFAVGNFLLSPDPASCVSTTAWACTYAPTLAALERFPAGLNWSAFPTH